MSPAWTVEVRYPRILLVIEIVAKSLGTTVVAGSFAYLCYYDFDPRAPIWVYLTLGLAVAYGGYETYKPVTWFLSKRLILAANEEVLQISNRRRKLDPPRVVPWRTISRIDFRMVAWTPFGEIEYGSGRANYIRYLNFVLPPNDRDRPLRVELSSLDRPVNVLVQDLKERSGACAISNVDKFLLEDHELISAGDWLIFWALFGAIVVGAVVASHWVR